MEGLGLKLVGAVRGETLFEFANHQMLGVKEVAELSERTKKKGRACHVAFNVSQEDFDAMLERIPKLGGKSLGDFRASDGLRPPGERSIYFFDPDTNYLQITAARRRRLVAHVRTKKNGSARRPTAKNRAEAFRASTTA